MRRGGRPGRRHDPTRGRKDHRIGEARIKKFNRVASGRDQGIWVISPRRFPPPWAKATLELLCAPSRQTGAVPAEVSFCHSELLPPLIASRIVRASAWARFILGGCSCLLSFADCAQPPCGQVLRCYFCGTSLPALDLQPLFFVVLALAALLLLMAVLFIAGLADL